MPPAPHRISAATTAMLHEAYYKIARFGHDHHAIYDCVRATLAKITQIDAFYVGLLHGANKVRYPYGYEGSQFDDSVLHTFGLNGPTAWLLKHQQTYRFAYDNGAVLHAGIAFGDTSRLSADVVTVPLVRSAIEGPGLIFGMISMHSYTPNTFSDEDVRAAEWLAGVLARVLIRQDEDRNAIAQLDLAGESQPHVLTSDRVIEYLSGRIGDLRRGATDILVTPEATIQDLREQLRDVVHRCEQIQVELIEMTGDVDHEPERRFLSLTPAEQALAMLLVDGLSNHDLAQELGISLNTVKTHLTSIRRKYGMSDRTQIVADVLRHLR